MTDATNRDRARRARRLAALAAAVASCALGACGIPADDEPRAVSQEQVPETTTSTVATEEGQTRAVDLYFVRYDGNRDVLTRVDHEVPTSGESGMPTPATVLDALLSGVPDDVVDPAIVSKVPPGTALASQPELAGSTLTIYLDGGISGVQADASRLAYGQIVCAADALDEVDSVRFEVDGEPLAPPDGDGATADGPLTCASYENVGGAAPTEADDR